ncbi:hypothetical protein AWB61_20635 [Chromobacterium sp. F49]|nr:hypothetical protein Cv017_15995 [Chromobacterium subtsugae]KZE85297.1 hypothetical protein AWB61_20635 [Chromobacterium sp. F49]
MKIEHLLQSRRDVWKIIPTYPYLAIDWERVQSEMPSLKTFVVFSEGQLLQNMRTQDLGARILGMLVGGGANAGFGTNSNAFVRGKANAKAWHLHNWNPLLYIGASPWIAAGTHFIMVDDDSIFQHEFAELITVNAYSRPQSAHFDFTALCDLRDEYNTKYLNNRSASEAELHALALSLDRAFRENSRVLAEAETLHNRLSVGMTSVDYDAPTLTKYDRLIHNAGGVPQVEIAYALLHYERAIKDFNSLKASHAAGNVDDALSLGINCVVSAAACVEAIANRLVYEATGMHPDRRDKREPVSKINDAGAALAMLDGNSFSPLTRGTPVFSSLDEIRILRNAFMHAKEQETDIDPTTSTSEMLNKVDEANCRRFLASVRECADKVYSQLPKLTPPIVIMRNVTWMGDLEVP